MKQKEILFSVVVTVYNKEDVLARCVNSLRNQSYKNIEIILVNDGSKDSSAQLCKEYADTDNRVRVINQKNKGVAAARNVGIEAANGLYVSIVDADDYLEDNVFENVAHLALKHKDLDMISWGCVEEDIMGKQLAYISMAQKVFLSKRDAYLDINSRLLGYVWLWAFRKEMITKNHLLFDQYFEPIDDYWFVLNAFDKATAIGTVQDTFYHYVRSNSLQSLSKMIPPHVFQQHIRISMFKYELFHRMGMDETYIKQEMKIAMYVTLKNGIKRLFRHEEDNIKEKIQEMIKTPEMQQYFYQNRCDIVMKPSELSRYNAVLTKDYDAIYKLFHEYELTKRLQSVEPVYWFPNNITNKEIAKKVLNEKVDVAVYGMFPFGDDYIKELLQRNVKVVSIFDASFGKTETGRSIYNIEIKDEDQMRNFDGVLIIAGNGSYKLLSEKAREYGVKHMLPYYFIYDGCSFDYVTYRERNQIGNVAKTHYIQHQNQNLLIIQSLELAITHRCTLNCEKCSNLISYFRNPKDADYEKMCLSIKKILDSEMYVNELRILGGEPFLNKDLHKYLHFLENYKNIGLISIMTNATIVPEEQTLDLLKDSRVYVTMSNYGSLSKKIDELIALFEKNRILYRVYDVTEWQDCNTIEFAPISQEELCVKMKNCTVNNCYTIYNNRLYRCPYNAGVTILKAIPQSDNDYLDLDKISESDIVERLRNYMNFEFSPVCAYCNSRPRTFCAIEVAKQLQGKHDYQEYSYKEQ